MPRLELYGAGSNSYGQLGIGHQKEVHTFTKCVFTEDLAIEDYDTLEVKICAGAIHTLLLISHDGQKGLFVAGSSKRKQLGVTKPENYLSFAKLTVEHLLRNSSQCMNLAQPPSAPLRIIDVAAAWETSFILFSTSLRPKDTKLLACGSNDYYQVAPSKANDKITLRNIANDLHGAIARIESGPRHTVALAESGEAFGWGSNRHGQLDSELVGTYRHPTPAFVGMRDGIWAFGVNHTCHINPKSFPCFDFQGDNAKGQLGKSDATSRTSTIFPTRQSTDTGLEAVFANWNTSFKLNEDASLLTSWGSNSAGQLGRYPEDPTRLGERGVVQFPKDTTDFTISQVSAGAEHTLALLENEDERRIYGWGWNEHGNMGQGDDKLDDVFIPIQLDLPSEGRILSVHAGNGTSWIAMVRE